MTFEKRCLIETADIIGIQYECDNCRAATVVPIEKISREQAGAFILRACPYCQKPSGFTAGAQETVSFLEFNLALQKIASAMAGRNLKMRLEIKCPE